MTAVRKPSPPPTLAAALDAPADTMTPMAALHRALTDWFPGRAALVSSFGTESAVLLHMAAQIDPAVPVLFLNTGKLFGETLKYRDTLVELLGLTDVRELRPEARILAAADPKGLLFASDPDRCCDIRKTAPLDGAVAGFDAWITGRKRFQSDVRSTLRQVERVGDKIKLNPLAPWTKADLTAYLEAHALPRHPLEADGYPSVGCMPCTDRVAVGEDLRAGRWRGQAKTECGIHR